MGIFTLSKRSRQAWRQAKLLVIFIIISVLLHLVLVANPAMKLGMLSQSEPPPVEAPMTYTDIATEDARAATIEHATTSGRQIAAIEPAPAVEPNSAENTSTDQPSASEPQASEATPSNADPTTPVAADAVPATTEAEVSPTATNQTAQTNGRRRFPARLTLSYDLFKGDEGIKLGHASHRWLADGDAYQLDSKAEATGMLAMLKLGNYSQQSRGRLTAQGITPEHYREMRGENRRHHYIADFDYSSHTLQLGQVDAINPVEFAEGTQDQLSFIYQLALQAPLPASITLPIATGRKYGPYTIDNLGVKKLRTPLGELNTLHLSRQKRQAKDETIDIWLAIDHHFVPVKIMMTDRKGDTYSQLITSINQNE